MDMLRKWTGENPDTMYLKARIDGTGYYKVTGKAADTGEWRDSARFVQGPKAPRLVTFPDHYGCARCQWRTRRDGGMCEHDARLHEQSADAGRRGRALRDPDRPGKAEHYNGNFASAQRSDLPGYWQGESDYEALWLSVREIFSTGSANSRWTRTSCGWMRWARTARRSLRRKCREAREDRRRTAQPDPLLEPPSGGRSRTTARRERRRAPGNAGQRYQSGGTCVHGGRCSSARQLYAAGNWFRAAREALRPSLLTPVEPHYIGFSSTRSGSKGRISRITSAASVGSSWRARATVRAIT